jgi:hypothetical protein
MACLLEAKFQNGSGFHTEQSVEQVMGGEVGGRFQVK